MARQRCPICRGPHTLLKAKPLAVLAATAPALARLVGGGRRAALGRRPRRGEWSVVEVLAHLADAEIASAFRIRKIVSERRPLLAGYDQEAWARALRYRRRSPAEAFATFRAVRESNLRILRSLGRVARRRVGIHSEFGPLRLEQLEAHLAEHDLNHLDQLRQTLSSVARRR